VLGARNAVDVSIFHATAARTSTGGRTVTYPATADATAKGQFVYARQSHETLSQGRVVQVEAYLILPPGTDVRPESGTSQNEATPDRVRVTRGGESTDYLCLYARAMFGLGEHVECWLIRER
jgi:hypothetical protein